MEQIIDAFRQDFAAITAYAPRLVYALGLVLGFAVAGRIAGGLAARVLQRTGRLRAHEHFFRNIVTWALAIVGFLLALGAVGLTGVATSLLATGGVVAIVLGFAFREIGENLLAGFFLAFSRPFRIGDVVKTGDLTGVVRAIELRHVHIRTFDACDVFVPSAQIFREPLYNYTRDGLRRPSFMIGIDYHDDPGAVLELLGNTIKSEPRVLGEPAPFVTVEEFAASHIVYGVYFWLDLTDEAVKLIPVTNAVKLACWRALKDAGVTFSTDVPSALELKHVPAIEILDPARP